jgi:peptide/nickel transport system permease protein
VFAAAVLAVAALAAIVPGLVAQADPLYADPLASHLPPSAEHWAGTDLQGRDVFSRIVYGARYSLAIGIGATALSAALGVVLGVIAGTGPTQVDYVISRGIDILGAFPAILFALVIITFTGRGPVNLIIALGIGGIPTFARLIRTQVLVTSTSSFVEQSRTFGLSGARLTLRHVLPNALGVLPVVATIGLGTAIIGSSSLSFLGRGPQPPAAEWGLILAESRNYLRQAWWGAVFPGVALTAVVIAATVLGRYLQRRYERRA